MTLKASTVTGTAWAVARFS